MWKHSGIFELDWSRFAASAPDRARSRRFLHLREGAAQSTDPGALAEMIAAASPSRRRQILNELVAGRVASVLGLGANDVQPDRALGELGIDSLMAVELSIGLEATLGRPLPVTLLQAERTLAELTDRIDRMFSAAEEKSSQSAMSEAAPDGRAGAFTPALRTLGPGQLVDPDMRCPAAALTYIPEEVVERGDFSPDQLAAAFGDAPFLSGVLDSPFGRVSTFMLPLRGRPFWMQTAPNASSRKRWRWRQSRAPR